MSDRPPITLRDWDAIDVGQLKGVGDKKQAALAAFEIFDVLDLVTTYPRRWVDRTNEARIADLVPGEDALVLVTVRSVGSRRTRNRRTMVNVNVGDGSGRMDVVFFNQPWRERQLQEGLQVALFGKADTYRGGLQMANPIVDLIGDRTGKIVPIYPQSEKAQINTWEMVAWVEEALRRCEERGIADQETFCRFGQEITRRMRTIGIAPCGEEPTALVQALEHAQLDLRQGDESRELTGQGTVFCRSHGASRPAVTQDRKSARTLLWISPA